MDPIALYVRPVVGRAVPRYGVTKTLIGARYLTPPKAERRAGAPVIEWDKERVVMISPAEYRQFRREYDGHVRSGDLEKVDRAAFDAFLRVQEAREAKHAAAVAKKKDAKKAKETNK